MFRLTSSSRYSASFVSPPATMLWRVHDMPPCNADSVLCRSIGVEAARGWNWVFTAAADRDGKAFVGMVSVDHAVEAQPADGVQPVRWLERAEHGGHGVWAVHDLKKAS